MPDYFPPDRFITAAAMYREDFANVTAHLTAAGPDDARQLHRAPLMHIEKQLADKTGQAIRFYLRLFFNPEPLRVTSTPPEELPGATANLTKRRSKVSEILTMTPPEGVATNPNSAVADGSISSVVSKALQCLYVRIGPDALLSPSFDASLLVPRQGFCTSAASQRGLPTKKCPEPITEEDIHTMIAEIHDAFTFLEVANACRFLSELVNWPGVTDEIAKVGGWSLVERYAKKIQQHGLLHCSSADAHFAPLSNVGQLFARMEQCRQVMQGPMKECELSLRSFSARFKCGRCCVYTLMPGFSLHVSQCPSCCISPLLQGRSQRRRFGLPIRPSIGFLPCWTKGRSLRFQWCPSRNPKAEMKSS
jgi:hypothetical protein